MKRIFPATALLTILALSTALVPAAAEDTSPAPTIEAITPSGEIENISEKLTNPALLVDGHVYLPLRSYATLFDETEVFWDNSNGIASVVHKGKRFSVAARTNVSTVTDSQGFLVAGRTYVPLRACVEFFDGRVLYDKAQHQIRLKLEVDLSKSAAVTPMNLGLQRFAAASAPYFLSKDKENECYSPLSLYLALSMVSQGAQDNTAKELMQTLHADSAPALAREAAALMKLNHKDKEGSLLLANSLWLDKNAQINPKFSALLEDSYDAESQALDLSSQEDLDKISQWILNKTNKLIQVKFSPSADEVMKLVNTLYFKGLWMESFSKDMTVDESFFAAENEEIKAPFMKGRFETDYLKTDDFESSSLRFKDGCRLRIILPAKGMSPKALLAKEKALEALNKSGEQANVNWSLPRFSFASKYDCIQALKEIGIKDAFTPMANFNGIAPQLFISSVDHLTKVEVNEEGAEAAAATIISVKATAMPIEEPKPEVNFQVNRPFLFILETKEGLPLFIGQVNNPTAK